MNKSISIFVLSLIFLLTTNLTYADDHQPVGPAVAECLHALLMMENLQMI